MYINVQNVMNEYVARGEVDIDRRVGEVMWNSKSEMK